MSQTIVVREIEEAHQRMVALRHAGRRVGLVLTMGALHEGHLSLIRAAREECDAVVASIFVNPSQFGPDEDLTCYPRTWESDIAAMTQLRTSFVFAPSVESMYPSISTTWVEPPAVAAPLEGEHRAGHFRGVATIVLKFFHILPADVAYFGQKDFQQCLVVRDMVRDMNVPIRLRFCDTVRDADGLAMSSRNRYLSHGQRKRALGLPTALECVQHRVRDGETDGRTLEAAALDALTQASVDRIDYVSLRDAETFEPMPKLDSEGVMLIAAHVGNTRLIDNCRLSPVRPSRLDRGGSAPSK